MASLNAFGYNKSLMSTVIYLLTCIADKVKVKSNTYPRRTLKWLFLSYERSSEGLKKKKNVTYPNMVLYFTVRPLLLAHNNGMMKQKERNDELCVSKTIIIGKIKEIVSRVSSPPETTRR